MTIEIHPPIPLKGGQKSLSYFVSCGFKPPFRGVGGVIRKKGGLWGLKEKKGGFGIEEKQDKTLTNYIL